MGVGRCVSVSSPAVGATHTARLVGVLYCPLRSLLVCGACGGSQSTPFANSRAVSGPSHGTGHAQPDISGGQGEKGRQKGADTDFHPPLSPGTNRGRAAAGAGERCLPVCPCCQAPAPAGAATRAHPPTAKRRGSVAPRGSRCAQGGHPPDRQSLPNLFAPRGRAAAATPAQRRPASRPRTLANNHDYPTSSGLVLLSLQLYHAAASIPYS